MNTDDNQAFVYAGFWLRVWATIIDSLLIALIVMPVLFAVYGTDAMLYSERFLLGAVDFLFSYVLPAVAIILFWHYRQATPGKMVIGARVVDARTGQKPSTGQFIGRYFAYYPSFLIFGMGMFWVAFDKRKQGWHDKLAGTVVIKEQKENMPAETDA